MDKNTLIGFVLLAVVLIGFSYYNQPSAEQLAAQARQDSIELARSREAAELKQQQAQKEIALAADTTSPFFAARHGQERTVHLKNHDIDVELSTLGGTVKSATLLAYRDATRRHPVRLGGRGDMTLSFTFAGKTENLRTADLYFEPEQMTDSTCVMRLATADGRALLFKYKLGGRYFLNLTIESRGMDAHLMPSERTMQIDWREHLRGQERGYKFENQYSTLTYKKNDGGEDHLSATSNKEKELETPLDWVAFKNQFFSSVLLSARPLTHARLKSEMMDHDTGYLKNYEASMQAEFDPSGRTPTQLQFYFGPNQYRLLRSMNREAITPDGADLQKLVYLGWPIVRLINKYFTIYVFDWLTALGLNMGIVLLLITLLLRAIVYVPTKKSIMSSIKMKVLKPKMDELNKKYPNPEDNLKKQQEMMALYSQYGVSPMGGCIPILVQMPIWIAMFNFIPNAIELRQQSFLWADDLSTYDVLLQWKTSVPLIGDHISLFCLLFCLTNVLYSWFNMRMQKDNSMMAGQESQMKMMKWMMYLMPVFFFFIFNDYSAGLNYYYFISLLAGALTMWYIRHSTDEKKVLARLEANYAANKQNPKKMSGFAARLEALQKQQQEQLNARKRGR